MVLENIYPERVMEIFESICAIPHGSGNTKALSDWCVAFARERGLEHYQDDLGNVIIIKPAAAGYENSPAVILQGHIDMVCQCEPDSGIDMEKEGLRLRTDGDRIYAEGTTLGGDDGIAVAMALAVLDSNAIPHPRLEVVLTVDEETGMYGAAGLDPAPLLGRTLLNIDSEEEGIFTVSCAGGVRANCRLPLEREHNDEPGEMLIIRISGLKGGHSGVEIDKGRANANMLMARLLGAIYHECDFRIEHIRGGSADNAIPFCCEARILANRYHWEKLLPAVKQAEAMFRSEYRATDPDISIVVEDKGLYRCDILTWSCNHRVLDALLLMPNGIQAMSGDIEGLVESSLNMGIIKSDYEYLRMSYAIRSSVESRKALMKEQLSRLMYVLGGSVDFTGEYPAWEYRAESPLRERMVEVYRRQYGTEPEVVAIHAGLECGLLSAKLPGLDCVSFGPDLNNIHTTRESMSVSSVARVWDFLLEVLKESK